MNKFSKMLAVFMTALMIAGAAEFVDAKTVMIKLPCTSQSSCSGNNCNTSLVQGQTETTKNKVQKVTKKKSVKTCTKKQSAKKCKNKACVKKNKGKKNKKTVKKTCAKKTCAKKACTKKTCAKKTQKKNSNNKSETTTQSQKKEETTKQSSKKEETTTQSSKKEETTKQSSKKEETTTQKIEKQTTVTSGSEEDQYVSRIVELVNEQRTKAGLGKVTLDNTLKDAAMTRAKETVTSFSHTRPNGTSFSTVLSQYNISYRGCGENIAWGQNSPEEVMNGWMNSSGHRANILNANYKKIGVGYYKAPNGRKYWSQLFIY